MEAITDPAVSHQKFEQEITSYRKIEDSLLRRGWMLLKAEFPEIFVVFATPNATPAFIPFGVLLDFTNYDFWAPSVRLVNPLNREPYKAKELRSPLLRRIPGPAPVLPPQPGQPVQITAVPLMQGHDPEGLPFLCLPGVREYHDHPAHSNDPWLRHRGQGQGTLYSILEQIYRYGVEPLTGPAYKVEAQLQFHGFEQKDVPQ